MASTNSPRQLNINCTISAVFLPEYGSPFGFFSRYRQQKDPTNTLPASFVTQIEGNKYSPNLATMATGVGGVLPIVNTNIIAPAATFTEGNILPGLPHKTLNLLVGAIRSKANPTIIYSINQSSPSSPALQSTAVAPAGNGVSSVLPFIAEPYIPVIGNATDQKMVTYNIWVDKFANNANKKYLLDFGVTNSKEIKSVEFKTTVSATGAKVTAFAQEKSCVLRRIFPIADDLAYDGNYLHYPEINGITKEKEVIKAKGGPNCGFWISMSLTPPSQDGKGNSSGMIIYWGYPNENNTDTVYTEFVLDFQIGIQPVLRYKIPGNRSSNTIANIRESWDKVILRGPIMNKEFTKLDIYVHYAGPNMYIGFSEDVSEWNVFQPISVDNFSTDKSDDVFFEPRQPAKSIIEIYLNRLKATYTYSPLCFNNFNAVNFTDATSNTKSNVKIDYNIPEKEYLSETNKPENLLKSFLESRTPIVRAGIGESEPKLPTFYGDWRRSKDNNDDYLADREFSYKELSKVTDSSIADNIRALVTGELNFETTIEGPILFYFRNYPESYQRNKITKPVWGPYSDVSSYLSNAIVTVSYETNRNRSYKTSDAKLTFANLTNDIIGIQILNAIQENVLVFTLKSGYGNDLKTFFQGVSREVVVQRSPDGFTVDIVCNDLGDSLLNDIRYDTISTFSLENTSCKQIFKDAFTFGGLREVYKPRAPYETGYDPLFDTKNGYLSLVVGALGGLYQNDLGSKVLGVNISNSIKETIATILSIFKKTKDNQPSNPPKIIKTLPVLYWDPEKEQFTLTLRSDEPGDNLFFAGDTSSSDGKLYLANNNIDREHGIVESSGWTETTSLNNLHSKVVFSGKLFNLTPFLKMSGAEDIQRAISTNSYNDLNSLIKSPATNDEFKAFQNMKQIGYVGYNKIYLSIDENLNLFKNELILNEQFELRRHYVRYPYTSLNLNVFVTKPLNTSGLFKIKSFEGGYENTSDEYIYKRVRYTFDIDNNLIRANIEGEIFPELP